MKRIVLSVATLTALLALPLVGTLSGTAQAARPSTSDSFAIGDDKGEPRCQVQPMAASPALNNMFDRAYAVTCRDAASAVGQIYALRNDDGKAEARYAALLKDSLNCQAPVKAAVTGLGATQQVQCVQGSPKIDYTRYSLSKGKTYYAAQGLTGYDSALQLALRNIVLDRFIAGPVTVATSNLSDPGAFARVQAGTLDIRNARIQAYSRSNKGDYAEAAEFFNALLERSSQDGSNSQLLTTEFLANQALQKSNMGAFAEADALFALADRKITQDPLQLRLRRNLKALHAINKREYKQALFFLNMPLQVAGQQGQLAEPIIQEDVSRQFMDASPLGRQLNGVDSTLLTVSEKAHILDAQALQIRGTLFYRLTGDGDKARSALEAALEALQTIRQGRVTSIIRLRVQTMAELAQLAEAEGKDGQAEGLLRQGLALLDYEYPNSASVNAGRARLAAFLARRNKNDEAKSLYRSIVKASEGQIGTSTSYITLMEPYFALLTKEAATDPAAVEEFFLASQILVRPGVAESQAILARELTGGSDEASGLFRQSLTLTRDIERNRVTIAHLQELDSNKPDDAEKIAQLQEATALLEAQQSGIQASLSRFPRYRSIASRTISLADLRATLNPEEVYLKTSLVGQSVYGLLVSKDKAIAYQTPLTAKSLDKAVTDLRETISTQSNGQLVTYAFNVALARSLYTDLFAPVADDVASARHIIFEPDGAMLRLPLGLLVTDDKSVEAYQRKVSKGGDEFDFRGVSWLARSADISTAVSAKSFQDVRSAPASKAVHEYLGMGSNQPVSSAIQLASTRSMSGAGGLDCNWPLEQWNRPIAATELKEAQSIIGRDNAQTLTGAEFTDTGLLGRKDLDRYRILHFATHGLVSAPRPECPARPALLTSFGEGESDGLLTFKEIYDLKLDADLVILSACDTAGKATVAATREAGIRTGGGDALDGLVRAFVGAGSRSILASHWPAPDDYKATERLIGGLFSAPKGTSLGQAMQIAERALMDDLDTSHPYYWSGFAIVGDAAQPVLK